MDNKNNINRENKQIKKAIDKCSKIKSNKGTQSLGLDRFSYADFVLLSSTLAYAIVEELNEEDLSLLISFINMLNGDLVMLRTQEAIRAGRETELSQQQEEEVLEETDTLADAIGETVDDEMIADLIRKPKKKKYKKKKIKKVK
ncbi:MULTISPECIES: hypothetical protein [Romboutsia]|uniref:Uncharacterized protein n=1 Tax=Romboutsia hominis TaxID=1507512 RepID=A0A2P2BR40_9FIRM|nr:MULTISPECIES: hypothetical protein [Romboutsia]MCH1960148.1 hypothetical protein [Romboutsia hominis]MCH1969418.1 hypothetical protein [Romboutsia hominis]MDB8791900.1 hypothetical protein [Romboutsia sp. 1001216sp1]MDB8794881.1 hypothetical protein [Romboutsia sp. 1001216sp1]MDB8796474.1 hypothetical protein [Romboutsia sp. 1001216sp1]